MSTPTGSRTRPSPVDQGQRRPALGVSIVNQRRCSDACRTLLPGRSPRRWWLYTGFAVPFLMLVIVITPIFITPLFDSSGR